jgi:DNA polymerase I-like protein with 3'-5' exonuclease and polymerase domains
MFPRLSDYPFIALDTETTGLKWWSDKVFGVAISAPDGNDWYWDIRRTSGALDFLKDEIPKCKLIICHNSKFDWHMCRESGIIFPRDRVDDTMIRAALIDEHLMSYDLDSLGKKYLKIGKDSDIWQELAELFGGRPTKNAQIANLPRAPASLAGRYAKQDTRVTLDLWQWQSKEIERQNISEVAELERRLLPVMVDMEYGGVRIDVERAEEAVYDIDKKSRVAQVELNQLAGFEVNPNPSNSIKELFKPKRDHNGNWVVRDGTVVSTTPAGAPSIDAAALRSMRDPAAALILKLRKLIKTRDTFLKGHLLGHHHDGVIHANFNQTKSDNDLGTGTGRLSVNSPALQQIHKRDEDIASVVRSLFIPDDSRSEWVCNDWAQMDFRVFAHYVNDERILKMYSDNPDTDFHKLAADLTGLPRSPRFAGDANAKQINLGLVFGMGQGKLAAEMGLPYTVETDESGKKQWLKPGDQAIEVFNKYHSAIPGVQDLLRNASSIAKSRGYVRTVMGRHIRFPGGQFTHKAGGLIFQGSAADALKVKLIELHDYLRSEGEGARLLLNVHDEFDCNVPEGRPDIKENISRIVTTFDGISTPIKFRVPVRTDQGCGANWWEASK